MKRPRKIGLILAVLLALPLLVLGGYGLSGYVQALVDAPALSARADRLIAAGRGGAGLGNGRIAQLLAVQDPGFAHHHGVDLSTPGAGMTTLTQSLAKRLAFRHFRPGLAKIRQTTYAMGLEQRLSKPQLVALFLDTVEMGRGPKGWMTGFFTASRLLYDTPPAALDQRRFLGLVAVMIAPAQFDLRRGDPALAERIDRIERLIGGRCRPQDERDVWLNGCAAA